MNKQRKTSNILNVFQYDEITGAVTLPSTLVLTAPANSDDSTKVPTTSWTRNFVASLGYVTGNQSVTISGDATGSGTTSIELTLANTAVTPGIYGSSTLVPVVTVDSKGRITSVSTASISGALTFTGDVTGTGTTGTSTQLTLANSGVTAGTYTKVTVDSKGRVTVGANATTSDISEGTNLYYTDARVLAYLGANNYATQSYVGTQIANLIDSAPGTLDTLNELAAALGDDPNFATTVATSIGTKQNQLNGTGFVKVSGTTVSYDNSTYLTSFTETDPIYVASSWYGTTNNSSNWNTAFGWGNHASAGYLTSLPSHNHDGAYMKTNRTLDTINTIDNGGDRYNPSVNNPTNEHYAVLTYGNGGNVTGQLATHFVSGQLYSRGYNSTWSTWLKYVVENGGSWGISVTGTAGSISGFNNPTTAATANTIVYRDGSGHITGNYGFYSYINTTDDVSAGTITHIVAKFGDNYHRSATAAKVQAFLGLGSAAYINASASASASTVVTRDSNAYIFAQYFNAPANSASPTTSAPTSMIGRSSVSDKYYYDFSAGAVQSFLGLGSMAYASTSSFAAVNGNASNSFTVLEINYPATNFNPSTAPRTNISSMSVKMWNNYFNGTGLGSDYGTVMQYYSLSGHVDSQVYFDASGGSWYRTASYNSSYGGWQRYLTDANYSAYALPLSGGTLTGVVSLNDSGYFRGSPTYGFRFNNSADTINSLIVDNSGNAIAHASMRAPIFFDSNNTNYYLDPSSTSSLRTVGSWRSDSASWDGEFNGKIQYHADSWYIQAANLFIYRNSGGSNVFTVTQGGSAAAAGDMRAPIFYDSNDTNYYGDFASTSRMNSIVYDNLKFSGDQTYGFLGRNVYADTVNGRGSDPLELNYYDGGSVIIGTGANGSKALYAGSLFSAGSAVITSANISSQSVNYASSAGSASSSTTAAYLPTYYAGGVQSNPQTYFGQSVGLRVAMTGHWSVWSDTLWINGYAGGDVLQMCALHTIRNGQPRIAISAQASTSSSYGTVYELWSSYNMDAPNKSGTSYYQVNTWLQMNGTHGIYWPSYYGSHIYVNTTTTYTNFRWDGQKNGYDGVWLSYSAVNGMMYDGAGNGGVYREANGRWYWYHHIGNNCTGISTSTTSSSYRAYVGGALYAEGDIVAFSDARKKTDIVTIDNALNKVINLRGVYYTRIDDPIRGRQTGVIAQEINEVLPEVVTYSADVDHYGVSYGNIVGVLIEAIKEQQLQIKDLKNKLDLLTQNK
jgi:hypothetical protein